MNPIDTGRGYARELTWSEEKFFASRRWKWEGCSLTHPCFPGQFMTLSGALKTQEDLCDPYGEFGIFELGPDLPKTLFPKGI